jgi:transcriptional repressor NrdR
MLCPSCGVADTKVIDSRPVEGGRAIRRRRECEACGNRFTSYERVEPQLMVHKRDGRLEPFSTTKLSAGVSAALADTPVSGPEVETLVSQVEDGIRSSGLRQVSSDEIGRKVLDALKGVDEVAYLRFASVYKEFQDAADFEREMAEMESAEQ